MKKKYLKIFVLFITTAVIFNSCLDDDDSEKRKEEIKLIQDYVASHYPEATPVTSDLYVIEVSPPTDASLSPEINDYVFINYTGKFLSTNSIFDTSDSIIADNAQISGKTWLTYNGPLKISVWGFYGSGGVRLALTYMKQGGSYVVIMPSLYAFNDYRPVIYEIDLLKVIKNPHEFEMAQIDTFINKRWGQSLASDSTKTGVTGLCFKNDSAGSGENPNDGQYVTFNYKLNLLSYKDSDFSVPERQIDSYDGYRIVLNSDNLISGLYGALKLMRQGDSAVFVIPYYRAFGVNPKIEQSTDRIQLPQYSTLVYYIKMTSITN